MNRATMNSSATKIKRMPNNICKNKQQQKNPQCITIPKTKGEICIIWLNERAHFQRHLLGQRNITFLSCLSSRRDHMAWLASVWHCCLRWQGEAMAQPKLSGEVTTREAKGGWDPKRWKTYQLLALKGIV